MVAGVHCGVTCAVCLRDARGRRPRDGERERVTGGEVWTLLRPGLVAYEETSPNFEALLFCLPAS